MPNAFRAFVCIGLAGLFSAPALASDCNDAIDQYNSALSDVDSYLRRYANCLSSSRGKDDCSSEFRRLRNAQNDIESAVSAIGSYCRD